MGGGNTEQSAMRAEPLPPSFGEIREKYSDVSEFCLLDWELNILFYFFPK
jgi:hypothetical protein